MNMVKKWTAWMMALALVLALGTGLAEEGSGLKITSPSGAPGLALATLAAEDPELCTIIAADNITAAFADETADLIVAPLNAGAKLFRAGKSQYKLAAVLTWGNLYFASQKEGFQLEDMNGAEVTLFGEGTQNAALALYVLEQKGIVPSQVSYLGSAANTQTLLLSDENAIVMTAEPALTAASIKNEKVTGIALNDLYEEVTGFKGFPQAGLFVKAETAEGKPEEVKAMLEKIAEAARKCESDLAAVAEAAVTLELLPNAKVATTAIPNCAIRYVAAAEAREQIETTAKIDLSQFGGEVPADEFYYTGE